jgi:two-component system response regulator DctR
LNNFQTVYLCDDEDEVRKSLSFLLRQHELQVCAYASGPELLAAVDATPKPLRGVFVLDELMSPMTGSAVHAQLLARGLEHRNPVLFLSGHGTIPMAVNAMAKGAVTFIVKPFTKVMVPSIMEALEKEAAWFAKAERCSELVALWRRLPARQQEIAQRVASGELNKVTADKLDVHERTAEDHRSKLFANLGLKSAPELATLLAEMRACGISIGTRLASHTEDR